LAVALDGELADVFGAGAVLPGGIEMVDIAIAWLLAHPLEGVGALALLSVVTGLLLVPRIHEIAQHGHPRC
jgi:hypothetical protein